MMILVKKGFISSNFHDHLFALPTFCGLFLIRKGAKGELSYKVKKEADPEGLLHQFFRKCPYIYCTCSYTNRSYTNRVRTTLSIILILLYHSLEK